jgi:hypothetical protein
LSLDHLIRSLQQRRRDRQADDAERRGRGMTDDIRLGAGRPVRRRPSRWSFT